MLKFMRRHAKSRTIKVVFWVIIAVFILWGVGSFTGEEALYAASVNGDEISLEQVRRTALDLERFYRRLYGDNVSAELLKSLDLRTRALDEMVNTALFRQEAERLGIAVNDDEVRRSISSIEGLTENGVFQRVIYFRRLRAQGLTPAQFEAAQRERLLREKVEHVITSSLHADEDEAREIFRFNNERVNLAFVKFDASDLAKEVTPTDDEVKAWFEKNAEAFREPERVKIDFLLYQEKAFEKDLQVSDEDVLSEYEAFKKERYTKPEEVHARHILVRIPPGADAAKKEEARKKAEAALARVKAGEDFASIAKDVSEDPSNKDKGGDLGFFTRGRMEESFENSAFGLEPGGVSELVETRFGFHVIRVDEKNAERQQPLDEVRGEIAERLRSERARSLARDAAFADSQQALAGKALEEIAKARGMELREPPPFAQNESVTGIPPDPEIVKSAFETPVGSVAEMHQVGSDFVVLRVKEKIPSHLPALEEVKARAESALREERGAAKAREKAEALLRSASEQKKALVDAAAAENLKVEETLGFARTGDYVPRIGNVPGLKKAAFELTPENPVATRVWVANGDAFIVALKERLPAEMTEFDERKDEIVKRHLEELRASALDAFLQDLKSRADIRVNGPALAGV